MIALRRVLVDRKVAVVAEDVEALLALYCCHGLVAPLTLRPPVDSFAQSVDLTDQGLVDKLSQIAK
jgi:hypothetical protein